MSLEWSLGENFIETVQSNTHIYTQGFLQTYLVSTGYPSEVQEFLPDNNLLLYPNPVQSKLYIRNNKGWQDKVSVSILGLDQKAISKSSILPGEITTSIDVLDFSPGVYILMLRSHDGQIVEFFKILKY